jgi:pantetheine-phosphate adenylyltransferase
MIAVYPGTFDPVTNGHLDIIRRAARFTERLIVTVMVNTSKKPLFSIEERLEHLRILTRDMPNVEVDAYQGLQAEYLALRGAHVLVRGLRSGADFDFEMQIAQANKILRPEAETLFIPALGAFACISSGLAKEIAACGGDLGGIVPDLVAEQIKKLGG